MKTRSNLFSIVIDKNDIENNKTITVQDLYNYLEDNNTAIIFYCFIEHKETVIEHYHLCIATYGDYTPKTIINDISKYLLINRNIVSVQVSRNFPLSVQYLTHKNDAKKWQYNYSEIITNNFVTLEDLYYRNINPFQLDFETLYNIIKDCEYRLTAVYSQIGIQNATKYRNLINDVIRQHSLLKERRIDLKND